MAFGLFGSKETPIERLASGKVKNEQEKAQLLQGLGQPAAEEVIPLVFSDDAAISQRGAQLFVARATPPAMAALVCWLVGMLTRQTSSSRPSTTRWAAPALIRPARCGSSRSTCSRP